MIYRRSFFAEAGANVAMLAAVLGGLASMVLMGRLITQTVSVSTGWMLTLLGFELVKVLPQLLTVSLFAGLVVTFSRMSQARELAAWRISGLGDRHWQVAVLAMALPMAVTVWVLALHVAPWSIRNSELFQSELAESLEIEDTAPGIFGEVAENRLVYHLDALSPDRRQALGIFIAKRSGPSDFQLVLATRAKTVVDDLGLRDLVMDGGEMHNVSLSGRSASRVSFGRAEFRIGREERDDNVRLRAYPLDSLGGRDAERVERLWRHAFGAAALLLCLAALPLGRMSPGSGRSYQVLLAVLVYWLYYALAGYAKDLGEGGEVSALLAAFGPLALIALPLAAVAGARIARRRS